LENILNQQNHELNGDDSNQWLYELNHQNELYLDKIITYAGYNDEFSFLWSDNNNRWEWWDDLVHHGILYATSYVLKGFPSIYQDGIEGLTFYPNDGAVPLSSGLLLEETDDANFYDPIYNLVEAEFDILGIPHKIYVLPDQNKINQRVRTEYRLYPGFFHDNFGNIGKPGQGNTREQLLTDLMQVDNPNDITPPTVIYTIPMNLQEYYSDNIINIWFSEDVILNSGVWGAWGTVIDDDVNQIEGNFNYDQDTRRLIFTPNNEFPAGRWFTLELFTENIVDEAGNQLFGNENGTQGNYIIDFLTEPSYLISIEYPQQGTPAITGPLADPGEITIQISVLDRDGSFIRDIETADFNIYVGDWNNEANLAQIVDGTEDVDQNLYELTVLPPNKDEFGLYDLTVFINRYDGDPNGYSYHTAYFGRIGQSFRSWSDSSNHLLF